MMKQLLLSLLLVGASANVAVAMGTQEDDRGESSSAAASAPVPERPAVKPGLFDKVGGYCSVCSEKPASVVGNLLLNHPRIGTGVLAAAAIVLVYKCVSDKIDAALGDDLDDEDFA